MNLPDQPVLSADAKNKAWTEPAAAKAAVLFIIAIVLGSGLGLAAPRAGEVLAHGIDATLLAMISLLFIEMRLGAVFKAFGKIRFLAIAWCANFILVPVIGFTIASLVVPGQPILFAGLMIYFLAPCTDWFLGFTRMAGGDAELGASLIPINLITQLLLFPLWLWLFTKHSGLVDFEAIPGIFAHWFLLPLLAAQALRISLAYLAPEKLLEGFLDWVGQLIPLVLAALIFQIFASYIGMIVTGLDVFARIALAVFLFFALTFVVGAALARRWELPPPQRTLLSMTMAARNAPLMLALTAIAIPNQPLILAVIVFGMLVEIPHLTALKQLMLKTRDAT
ncbi:MAG: arsenic resistance protein [Pseudomonadota bacterium]